MGLDGIYNVPEFRYQQKVEKHAGNTEERKQQQEQGKKKKKQDDKAESLFESLADSLGQYSDEPFQFSG
ncbi:hypothetical protein COW36_22895 [bacterium (Candidatus Blackallbacteria) CG17_big_fil_post_rev_8_21_14_2_50_48_46]|uniref:Uncharacterized protein n=1 Tax=bacterium (Candidatus Blackallbacteria) CG17_big_fil_post_rev_8_21_14_2_50_48_46 TaxID=2014261 RepID=A0A2M7FZ55_9BACT|nr:MAG: hypothetical protein COW64_15965 [bacterium (Candidatus Blackallbacteria) CG18_big_fil_WC_8_21_14_2_50_49_26]PIW14099.1 MAG: hypothetical protein COW36_22895 [bacterium (Candidatus Blackallbacteria) CG17_big_fil_post_rev_8_21_14_2_50_48_46]PIW45829.1 MAG: hypothetical protein COW20_18560 [bacterium (Candidatus Blackallbacteria) CG13_big_fil_rev_8_21_14_2_50_49_14]